MNRQPWKLVMYHNRIHLFQKKNRVSWNDMQRFDMGIILYHIVAAAEERWLVPEIVRLDSIVEQKMRDYQYITTVKLTGV